MNVEPWEGDETPRCNVFPWRQSCAISVALLVLVSRPLLGAENPSGFHVVKERDGDTTTLIIKSDYACEFTVTFEATLKNTTASRPVPFTVDAAGRSSFELVRFGPTNKRLPWRYNYLYYKRLGGRRASTTNDADYAMPFKPGRYVVMQGPLAATAILRDQRMKTRWTGRFPKAPSCVPPGKAASSV